MTGGRLEAPEWENAAKTNAYRGFGETLASLAAHKHSSVIELVVDVNQLLTGVSCHVFDEQCKEYDDLVTLLQTPRFRRLDLALTVARAYTDEWQSFRNGRLRNALAQATGMEHMHIRTDITGDADFNAAEPGSGGRLHHFIPLHSIFPIEKWPRLRHFGLSGFVVTQDDVYNFLKDLPPTVRTVELSFLHFLDFSGGYADLLKALRDTLRWKDRPEDQRITLIIGLDTQHGNDCEGRAVWIEKEVADFLYNNGRNPFADEDGTVWKTVIQDCAGTVRDAFVPEHERPWALPQTLVALGLHKDPFAGHHIELPSFYTRTWLRQVRTSAI